MRSEPALSQGQTCPFREGWRPAPSPALLQKFLSLLLGPFLLGKNQFRLQHSGDGPGNGKETAGRAMNPHEGVPTGRLHFRPGNAAPVNDLPCSGLIYLRRRKLRKRLIDRNKDTVNS